MFTDLEQRLLPFQDGQLEEDQFDPSRFRIAICGHGGAGKDEAAQYLAKQTGMRYTHSTSYAALDFIFAFMKDSGWNYATKEECYEDRKNWRETWAFLIDRYNRDDPTKLYRRHLTRSDFLVGIRKHRELIACRREMLFDLSVWIENIHVPPDATLEYEAVDCDIMIYNNADLCCFHEKLRRFARCLGWIHVSH